MQLWHIYSNIWTITLAQIHIVSVMLSIFWAYIKLEAGPNLADQSFRQQELDAAEKLFNRTWCDHDCLRGATELICKSYSVLWGGKSTAVLQNIIILGTCCTSCVQVQQLCVGPYLVYAVNCHCGPESAWPIAEWGQWGLPVQARMEAWWGVQRCLHLVLSVESPG